METCFGVDGCRGGWVLVGMGPGRVWGPHFVSRFTDVLQCTRGGGLVLVDIPIGLPGADQGERRCDVVARRALRERGCTVFAAPVRELLAFRDFKSAADYQRQLTGKGLTIQAYSLLPKIREVDQALRQDPGLQDRVRESHPELCFAALRGGEPVRHPKRSKAGYEERLETLRRYVPGIEGLTDRRHVGWGRWGPAPDDVRDALALAVNAWLGTRYGFTRFPTEGGDLDHYGLRMEMRW